MKWKNANEQLPDSPDYWLATNKPQEGKPVCCKIYNIIGHGFFWRRDGKMCFSYSYERKENGFWHTDDNAFIDYPNFNRIEWLDEQESIPADLPVQGYSLEDMKNAFEAGESLQYFRDMGDKDGFHDLGKPKEFSEFIYPPATAVGVHGQIYTTDEVWKIYAADPRYGKDLSYSQFAKENGWVMIKKETKK